MQGEHSTSFGSTILRDVLRLLDGLKQSPAGIVIHDQISRLLVDCETEQQRVEQDYLDLLSVLLEAYSRNPSSEHVMQVTAKLIQLRPVTRLSRDTINTLRFDLLQDSRPLAADHVAETRDVDEIMADLAQWTEPAAAPNKPVAADAPSATAATAVADPASPPPLSDIATEGVSGQRPVPWVEKRTRAREKKMQEMLTDEETTQGEPTERRVNSAYRMHLDRKRDEIDKLQETLVNKVVEAINQNKEFGALLEIERGAMQQAETVQEIESLRQILLGGIDELLQGQRALATKLRGSKDYLQLVKSDSERLHDELSKVRLLSLTDEFTGLPNRRAFMRRLEDEIGRSQRYATPLTLAMIDLDEFKAINDTLGHAAGDDVLRCYANNVLSIFRHHDMVARYGGEEFSVILPNTAGEGAMCAMKKVQSRVASVHYQHAGRSMKLPTFSAGLTLYVPGEPPTALIDRADRALYSAKRRGRNRVEVDIADGGKSTVPEGANRP